MTLSSVRRNVASGTHSLHAMTLAAIAAVLIAGILLTSAAMVNAQSATIRVGTIPLGRADAAFDVIAQREGIFADLGLNVEFVELNTGALVVQSLVAGHVDAIIVSPPLALAAIAGGAPIKIIGSHSIGLPYMLYVNDSINSLQDLRGKRLGISVPGSFAHVLMLVAMEKGNVGEREAQMVATGNDAERFRTLAGGRVDATVTHMEYQLELEQLPHLKVLMNYATEVPDYLRFVVVARNDVIQRRPQDVQALATGLAKGARLAIENPDVAIDLMAEMTQEDRASMAALYDMIVSILEPDFYLSPNSINYMQELNVTQGQQNRVLPVEDVATWQFHEGVIEALGPYQR